MKKITCLLFATHHNSKNIASIRYKSLIKYMDQNSFKFIIITKAINNDTKIIKKDNVTIIPVIGSMLGQNSIYFNLKIFFYLIFRFVGKCNLVNKILFSDCWANNAVSSAQHAIFTQLNSDNEIVVMGSYSPIDALIAASTLSIKYDFPLIQDFRDGFLFESLGRKSKMLTIIRRMLESRACKKSSLIMSVSNPLVEDFKTRYPNNSVVLMHNGFDPEDFSFNLNYQPNEELIKKALSNGKKIIGHFGRISCSDASRWDTLKSFIKTISALNVKTKANYVLLFVGELENKEKDLINNAEIDSIILNSVERYNAIALMSLCEYLLLLTGDSIGCATGKVFEYINSNKKVICFTGVKNEAEKILTETGAGYTFISDENNIINKFDNCLSEDSSLNINLNELSKYNKLNQSKYFEDLLFSLTEGQDVPKIK